MATNTFTRNARSTGLACGLISVALGIAYLIIADAPSSYIIINLCATVIGVGSFIATNNAARRPVRVSTAIWTGLAAVLLGTTVIGVPVEGASRWLRVGSMALQPSLILVPAMLVAYSQRRSVVASISIMLVAVALALQPDRAMAGVLASATIVLAVLVRERLATAVALCAVASFGVTLYRADTLPAVPYVDRILFTAFDVNLMIGCAVVLGAGLLLLPALLARSANNEDTRPYAVFGMVWLTIVAAAALGNYPTPIVGYGGSAIVGYFLSIAFLPNPIVDAVAAAHPANIPIRNPHDAGNAGTGQREHFLGGVVAIRGFIPRRAGL